MKKIISLLLLAAMLASVSCGADTTTDEETTTVSDETTVQEAEYEFPTLDLGGRDFNILNTNQTYGFYTTLDIEVQTGDAVDDAIYSRNRNIEDRFKVNLVVDESYSLKEAANALQQSVLAGDDTYDVAFIRDTWLTGLITDDALVDLQDYDGFNFDEPWWDTVAIEGARIGDKKKINYAYTDFSLTDFEGTLVTFINEDYMTDLNLDSPYDLVREGKWTIDKLAEYMKAGANLNGADDYTYSESNDAKYGLTTWDNGFKGIYFGAGANFILANDGQPEIAAKGETFINAVQKVLQVCSTDGEFLIAPNTPHYETVFKNGKALLMVAQLKAANNYRDMKASYGILPMAKYDENQENYRCLRTYSYVMCVPKTSETVEDTAVVMDALSYLTYKNVMGPFYNGRVSMKTLRNDDSIEMLSIIQASRTIDVGLPYGWSGSFHTAIFSALESKSTDIVSSLESTYTSVEESISSIMENMN